MIELRLFASLIGWRLNHSGPNDEFYSISLRESAKNRNSIKRGEYLNWVA